MTEISRIHSFNAAKIVGSVFSVFGFFCGVLYAGLGLVFDVALTGALNQGTALAFLALLGMPLLFGIPAAVSAFVFCVLYNLTAKRVGGFTLELTS